MRDKYNTTYNTPTRYNPSLVYLINFLQKVPFIYRLYMVLANTKCFFCLCRNAQGGEYVTKDMKKQKRNTAKVGK
jgi:hypothetical protein